jgi:hypothetical protein
MAITVTPQLIEDAATALSTGGWRYTPKQLYYATCAVAETPATASVANGEIALGVLFLLVGLILINVRVAFAALEALGVALIVFGVIARVTHKPPVGRVLVISFSDFEQMRQGLHLPGLIQARPRTRPPATPSSGRAIVCDTSDNALAVSANLEAAGLNDVVVVDREGIVALDGHAAAALHDASPRGCALALELRDAGITALDAGLRPAWVDSPAYQVLEGAPARLPRDLSPLLSDAEIAWLGSGRRVELAVLPPARLMRLAQAALEMTGRHPDASGSGAPGLVPSLPDLP